MIPQHDRRAPWLLEEPCVKFGRRPNAAGSAFDDVFKGTPGTEDEWIIATPATATVTSSNVADANGEVTLLGYDSTGRVQRETVTLDASATPTATTSKVWHYANARAIFDHPSTRARNTGEISIVVSGVTVSVIEADFGQTLQAFYMIPAFTESGKAVKEGCLRRWFVGCGKNAEFDCALMTSINGHSWRTRDFAHVTDVSPGGTDYRNEHDPRSGLQLKPFTFVKIAAARLTGSLVYGWFECEFKGNE